MEKINHDVIEKNWVEGATLDKMVRKLLFEETLGLRHDMRGSQLFKAPGEKQPLWSWDGQELVLFDDTGKTNVAQK